MDVRSRLAALLDPIELDVFFARYYEREPLHIRTTNAAALLTHDALREALGALQAVPATMFVFSEHFEGGAHAELDILRDPSRLDAYLSAGLPIVWNSPRGVFHAIDALAAELSLAFGARVWPNVYATGEAGTPFGMHFDSHEVLAVHCAGSKRWRISSVRADHPLDDDAMSAVVRDWMIARADDAERAVSHTFDVTAGDVVYIPRGMFHNARTAEGRSLHVTFGVRCLTGHDATRLLTSRALGDAALRRYAPAPASDPDGARASAWARDVLVRLGEHLLAEDFLDDLGQAREALLRAK